MENKNKNKIYKKDTEYPDPKTEIEKMEYFLNITSQIKPFRDFFMHMMQIEEVYYNRRIKCH